MTQLTFVLGGCKSGKSGHALKLADALVASRYLYIATCVPADDEMRRRVWRHQKERSQKWETLEEPLEIATAISQQSRSESVVLVDCLTLWITNLLMEDPHQPLERIEDRIDELCRRLRQANGPVLLVSNEVGTGIVPDNRLARFFRDAAGLANQKVAAVADQVIWIVAGIPVQIK